MGVFGPRNFKHDSKEELSVDDTDNYKQSFHISTTHDLTRVSEMRLVLKPEMNSKPPRQDKNPS